MIAIEVSLEVRVDNMGKVPGAEAGRKKIAEFDWDVCLSC